MSTSHNINTTNQQPMSNEMSCHLPLDPGQFRTIPFSQYLEERAASQGQQPKPNYLAICHEKIYKEYLERIRNSPRPLYAPTVTMSHNQANEVDPTSPSVTLPPMIQQSSVLATREQQMTELRTYLAKLQTSTGIGLSFRRKDSSESSAVQTLEDAISRADLNDLKAQRATQDYMRLSFQHDEEIARERTLTRKFRTECGQAQEQIYQLNEEVSELQQEVFSFLHHKDDLELRVANAEREAVAARNELKMMIEQQSCQCQLQDLASEYGFNTARLRDDIQRKNLAINNLKSQMSIREHHSEAHASELCQEIATLKEELAAMKQKEEEWSHVEDGDTDDTSESMPEVADLSSEDEDNLTPNSADIEFAEQVIQSWKG